MNTVYFSSISVFFDFFHQCFNSFLYIGLLFLSVQSVAHSCQTLCDSMNCSTTGLQKNIYFFFIDYAKAFDWVDHNKLWKILKDMGIPDLPLEKPVCRSGSNS